MWGARPAPCEASCTTLERIILETAAAWEQEGVAHGEIRPIIGAVDETFLQRMMLVFMDLASGYLLMEEVAVDRSYDTWYGGINARLKTFGTEVLYLVSDRAKALVKLAHTGLDCLSIPDLFHLSHDLAKGYSLAIFSRLRQAQQALEQARQRLEALQASQPEQCPGPAGTGRWWRPARPRCNAGRVCAAPIGSALPICRGSCIPGGLWTRPARRHRRLNASCTPRLQALETLLETNGLPVKKGTLDKVRKQLAGVSALVDFWWQTVRHDLAHMAMPPRWTQWVEELLLPLMYWQEQLSRTRCPGQKAQIALVLQAVQEAFERHPCTGQLAPEVLAGWKSWAGEHARAFQRASSAVEGRNGYLSQLQHNQRGLPKRRYQVWTVLHNFDCRAADGTTPAARFFRRSFPDLFESVLSQIDELPLPRQRHQAIALSD